MSHKHDAVTTEAFHDYFSEVRKRFLQEDYTEGTFRTPLENFLKKLNTKFEFNQEPDRATRLGAPDYKVFRNGVKIGYVETKELEDDLDKQLGSPQITKYKESINNIVLTNYTRFILIRNNQKIFDVDLFTTEDLSSPNWRDTNDRSGQFLKLNETFVSYNIPTILSGEELAFELSKRAKMLRDLAEQQLKADLDTKEGTPSSLFDFLQGIKELINDISIGDCADAYAQTITYGLFLARVKGKKQISRETAAIIIPQSIGIIRKIFSNVAADLPPNLTWIIDEIVEVLNASDMDKVLSEIDERGKKDRDPFTFFYEDFLQEYDPEKRKHLGVYYTPRPVINYIVNSVNTILKKDFDKNSGYADDTVTVLDPAAGTGTFLWLVYLRTLNELKDSGLSGLIKSKVSSHILRDFYGFEILITPYIFAHLKLSTILSQWHYSFKDNDRIPIYLTNTLEPSETHGLIPFMRELNEESENANKVKQEKKILAIVSNPPYSGTSYNKGKWIQNLLKVGYKAEDGRKDQGYFFVDGKPLGEKNPKWLQDDYVKFVRFAQWKIDVAGEGVVGFITNHAYLDNPTFRGMRRSLMSTFDKIFVLNLHGNASKKEKAPDGGKDENVFDIKQGVAITLFVKNRKPTERNFHYFDIFGTRKYKYEWLDRHRLETIEWKPLSPSPPYYLFVPSTIDETSTYTSSSSLPEIFPVNNVGIVTARDNLTIHWTENQVWSTIERFTKMDIEEARSFFKLGKDVQDWKVSLAQQDLKNSGPSRTRITPILYRPFDKRFTYYTGKSRGFICRPRPDVMQHMLSENIALVSVRQVAEGRFNHATVADTIIDARLTTSNKGIAYIFPLYTYNSKSKKPNVSENVIERFSQSIHEAVAPEEVFHYAYAILNSETYRVKFADQLKIDYPRIPIPNNIEEFKRLVELGKHLVELHLLRAKQPTHTHFNVTGSNLVSLVKFDSGRIWINKQQYFDNIPAVAWNFEMCGYFVLDHWLKERRNRELTGEEIEQFLQIVESVKSTTAITKQIDAALKPFL